MELQELIAQKEQLEATIREIKTKGCADAVAQIRALMIEYRLRPSDIGGAERKSASQSNGNGNGSHPSVGRKAAVKFRDTATGSTWSGRGMQPRWLKAAVEQGRSVSEFAV